MCGLVYSHSPDPVKEKVWKQYESQKSRGTQGFGVFDGKYVVKSATEKRMKRWFKRDQNNPTTLLFHHRFPTSTANVRRAAHPFHTGAYFGKTRYILAHNGVIRNSKELQAKHKELGITYSSVQQDGRFNDSEALLWDVALTLEGKQDKMTAYGDMAIICIKLVDGEMEKLFFGRNSGRPLKIVRGKKSLFLSSEGEGDDVVINQLYTYSYSLNRLTHKYFRMPMWSQDFYDRTTKGVTSTKVYDSGYGYDYYYDGNGNKVYYDNDYFDDGDSDEIYDRRYEYGSVKGKGNFKEFLTTPTETEINKTYYRILAASRGNFEDAYYTAAAELYLLTEEAEEIGFTTVNDQVQLKVLEAVIQRFVDDPDYIDDKSFHKYWKATEQKKSDDRKLTSTETSFHNRDIFGRKVIPAEVAK